MPLGNRQILVKSMQDADQRVAEFDGLDDAPGRRIEIDGNEPRAPALAAPAFARRQDRGPAIALRHTQPGCLEAALQRSGGLRHELCGRQRRPCGRGIARRMDQRVELIVPDEKRTRERDRNEQNGKADAKPQMDLQEKPAQPGSGRGRHRALFIIVPSNSEF